MKKFFSLTALLIAFAVTVQAQVNSFAEVPISTTVRQNMYQKVQISGAIQSCPVHRYKIKGTDKYYYRIMNAPLAVFVNFYKHLNTDSTQSTVLYFNPVKSMSTENAYAFFVNDKPGTWVDDGRGGEYLKYDSIIIIPVDMHPYDRSSTYDRHDYITYWGLSGANAEVLTTSYN